jgi:hypothetical protein
MAYAYHDTTGIGDIHIAHNLEYSNQTNRKAATFASKNVDNLIKQTDNGSFWRVTAAGSPGTSVPFTPPTPLLADIGKSVVVASDGAGGVKYDFDAGGSLWAQPSAGILRPQTVTDVVQVGDGTVSVPGVSFATTTDMGMYRAGALELGFAVGGSKLLSVSPAGGIAGADFVSTSRFLASNGTAALPAITFTSTTNMGMYRAGALELGFAVGGSKLLSVSPAGGIAGADFAATGGLVMSGAASSITLENNTQTSGNVASFKSTPAGASTTVVMALEADGTNWSTGSRVLKVTSDDDDAVPITINDGATDVMGLTRSGTMSATGSVILTGTSSKITLENNTQTSGNVVSIKSTPGSSSTAVILKLEADGTNWGSGAHILEIVSDDADARPFTINNGVSDTMWINQDGKIVSDIGLQINSGGSITSTSNGNITFTPNGTGITVNGTGTGSHGLNASGDFYNGGDMEIDGTTYFDNNAIFADNFAFAFGSAGTDAVFEYDANAEQFLLGLLGTAGSGNQFVIVNNTYRSRDFDHATQTNPTIFVHSATDPDTNNTQWLSLAHNQTDGVIDCGTGTLNLGGTANVNFAGATRTASTVTHDSYVELEVAGTLYKFMLGS